MGTRQRCQVDPGGQPVLPQRVHRRGCRGSLGHREHDAGRPGEDEPVHECSTQVVEEMGVVEDHDRRALVLAVRGQGRDHGPPCRGQVRGGTGGGDQLGDGAERYGRGDPCTGDPLDPSARGCRRPRHLLGQPGPASALRAGDDDRRGGRAADDRQDRVELSLAVDERPATARRLLSAVARPRVGRPYASPGHTASSASSEAAADSSVARAARQHGSSTHVVASAGR